MNRDLALQLADDLARAVVGRHDAKHGVWLGPFAPRRKPVEECEHPSCAKAVAYLKERDIPMLHHP